MGVPVKKRHPVSSIAKIYLTSFWFNFVQSDPPKNLAFVAPPPPLFAMLQFWKCQIAIFLYNFTLNATWFISLYFRWWNCWSQTWRTAWRWWTYHALLLLWSCQPLPDFHMDLIPTIQPPPLLPCSCLTVSLAPQLLQLLTTWCPTWFQQKPPRNSLFHLYQVFLAVKPLQFWQKLQMCLTSVTASWWWTSTHPRSIDLQVAIKPRFGLVRSKAQKKHQRRDKRKRWGRTHLTGLIWPLKRLPLQRGLRSEWIGDIYEASASVCLDLSNTLGDMIKLLSVGALYCENV